MNSQESTIVWWLWGGGLVKKSFVITRQPDKHPVQVLLSVLSAAAFQPDLLVWALQGLGFFLLHPPARHKLTSWQPLVNIWSSADCVNLPTAEKSSSCRRFGQSRCGATTNITNSCGSAIESQRLRWLDIVAGAPARLGGASFHLWKRPVKPQFGSVFVFPKRHLGENYYDWFCFATTNDRQS